MTSKERMMCAVNGEKPDRLPVTVHQWQGYHLEKYLNGVSDLEAFEKFGMDAAVQYFQDMGQFWLVNADFTKFSTSQWRDEINIVSDNPDWVHELLQILLEKKLQFIESLKGAKFDFIETGGGASSSTLISPDIHKKFCLPYDKKMHDALHDLGFKVTYHTCGGTYGIEEMIVANGADVSETLAPKSIGGNQEPWEVKEKVGNRIALIGGMD